MVSDLLGNCLCSRFLASWFMLLGCRVRHKGPGKETHFFGLTVLMQSSSSYLVSPLIISSACVFSSLAD